MSGVQVFILLLGAVLFTVSFFIPEKKDNIKETYEKEEKAVKDVLKQELARIQGRVEEAVEESLDQAKDKADRAMDRMTNEKMMAISEYSDTVLSEIHKNHEEAVFLYDMLNHKHDQVKGTVANLNQTVRSVKQRTAESVSKQDEEKEPAVLTMSKKNSSKENIESKERTKNKKSAEKSLEKPEENDAEKPVIRKTAKSTVSQPAKKKAATPRKKTDEKNVEVVIGSDDELNSNDQILQLHKAGKSNMEIARELGLGIGEVKLVIDLFEGGM